MSELAFDCNGDPFAFHARTKRLRVRLFRNPGMRGAPEVVADQQGGQLFVAPSTTFLEFRQKVGGEPGRYRLDQCDDDGNPIKGPSGESLTPAYVTIIDPRRNFANASGGGGSELENVVGVLADALAQTSRTMAENYAAVTAQNKDVIQAVTGLIGIAAGLPRPDLAAVFRNAMVGEVDDDEQDEADEEEVAEQSEASKLASDLLGNLARELPATVIRELMVPIQAWFLAKVRERAARMTPPAAAETTPHRAPEETSATEESDRAAAGASSAAGVSTNRESLSPATPTAAQMEKLIAISAKLSPREAAIAHEVALRMSDEQRASWLAELGELSIDDGLALVRSMIPGDSDATQTEKHDGAR